METAPDTLLPTLRRAGLTESQAKGYLALIEHGALTPAELAKKTSETRTNGYMVADKLEKLGLAIKKEDKKVTYTAMHPAALEALAERRRKVLMRNEQEVKNGLPQLVDLFYKFREEPGARTLQGVEGIKEVYMDTLRAKEDIYLIRTQADILSVGRDFMNDYREQRAKNGIHTYAITPLSKEARQHIKDDSDERLLYHRTLIPEEAYTAPVEMDIYGDNVALIAFGDTQMATIISSPPLAEAMRQLHGIISNHYATDSQTTIASIQAG